MTEESKAPDWQAIEAEFRAGVKSVRQIAREHDVSHTAVNTRAKGEGWWKPAATGAEGGIIDNAGTGNGTSAAAPGEPVEPAEVLTVAADQVATLETTGGPASAHGGAAYGLDSVSKPQRHAQGSGSTANDVAQDEQHLETEKERQSQTNPAPEDRGLYGVHFHAESPDLRRVLHIVPANGEEPAKVIERLSPDGRFRLLSSPPDARIQWRAVLEVVPEVETAPSETGLRVADGRWQ